MTAVLLINEEHQDTAALNGILFLPIFIKAGQIGFSKFMEVTEGINRPI
jgi:hypothetical protein